MYINNPTDKATAFSTNNFGFSEILKHDLREDHRKKKRRRRNRSYQRSNNTLDEYISIFEENRVAYDSHDFRQSGF
ncbi:MAG: hypothetical protein JO297_00325 [Nitrososphaeraceae archaeon]|nr:hypothetical protein [Nitrososphaeraceae archaeon]